MLQCWPTRYVVEFMKTKSKTAKSCGEINIFLEISSISLKKRKLQGNFLHDEIRYASKKWSPPVVIKGCLAKNPKFEMFIKDFCWSTNVSIWQIFFRKICSRLREYKNNICVSEITEKRSQQNSRFSTFEKLAFRSSNSPIWDWWMWNDCDKCCQTWLWLRKMLPWIPLSISAKNPHGSPQGNPHLLLKVKDWYLEKSIRNLSNFTDSSTYFTPLSRPPRRSSLRSSSKIYSVSFQVSYFGSDLNFDSSDF